MTPRQTARLPGRGPDIPLITLTAHAPGPAVVLTANLHGDEYTGTAALLALLPRLERDLRCGRLLLLPSLNLPGLRLRARRFEDEDLNRLFPGSRFGSPAAAHAARLWAFLSAEPFDLLLDLHADTPDAIPYALIDRAVSLSGPARASLEARCAALAAASGLAPLREYPDDRYARFRLDRSLTGAVINRLHRPALTLEAGPRLHLDPAASATMQAAVVRILHALDMLPLPHDLPAPRPPPLPPGPWRRDSGPRSAAEGLLSPLVRPGALCSPGHPLASVRSLTGDTLETICAPSAGFVIAWTDLFFIPAQTMVCTWAEHD